MRKLAVIAVAVPGQVAVNAVNAGIGYENHPDIQARTINFANNAGHVDVVFDVAGYFVEPQP
ncbi:hypothetical protein [Actinophytocola oryzae]|uniref:Uncharacterized protein n=1 Tax=Actinophytocola oryzae TaxID=502181 RepID=A0A4R7VWA0_9PSEU|nr:hypothetical protein [Actinophytocola oryzae]TDV53925.1 hypothetical protein CLV71_104393 [Actinophytocola oryzae]